MALAKAVGTVAGLAGKFAGAGAYGQAAAQTRAITALNVAQINNQIEWKEWEQEFALRNARNEVKAQTRLATLQGRMIRYNAIHQWNLANRDAKAFRLEAESVREHASENMRRTERAGYEQTQRIRGAYTKGGVMSDSGSAAIVVDQQIRDVEMQEQQILQEATDRSNQLEYAAQNRQYEGKIAMRFGQQQAALSDWAGHKQAFEMNRARNFMRLNYQNEIQNMRIQAALTQLYGDQQAQAYDAQRTGAIGSGLAGAFSGFGNLYADRQQAAYG